MPEVKELRKQIDEIDRKVVEFLDKRVEIVKEIGRLKRDKGAEIFDPERESKVLDNVSNSTKLDREFIRGLFKSIIEYCKNEE
jgi:chorismate mutase/prephenate dehydratase